MKSVEGDLRLFVALWPSRPLAEEIALTSARAVGDGRPVTMERLHVTLQFLGDVRPTRLAGIHEALGRVSSPAFDLLLDRFGYWHRTRVVWLGPARRCEPLTALVSEVAEELRTVGFRPEKRAFRCHFTVARNCRSPGNLRPPRPLCWTVEQFCLVASTLSPQGALYRKIQAIDLT